MSSQPDIRAQLRSLSIPKDQRPNSASGRGGGGERSTAAPRPTAKARGGWGKVLGIIVVLLFIGEAVFYFTAGSLYLFGLGSENGKTAAADVSLFTVTERTDTGPMPVHTATGKIVSDHKVRVTTKVSGQIIELLFEQGDMIQKGQVLARLESVLPKARRDEAAAALIKAKANLAYQKTNFERIERLFNEQNAPEIEYAEARRAFEESQAQVEQNQALLDWSEKVLRDCEVVAPISGVILERNVEVGDFVAAEGGIGANANAQFGTIADMNVLRVEVDISELDIARIKKDMPCKITPDAYKDRKYEGHVMWIDPGANYSKATVQVKVRIENPDRFLRVEGVAQVVFLAPDSGSAGGESGGIWIPASACSVSSDGKSGRVFVVNDGRLKESTVTLGQKVASQLEVTDGLSVGQKIASGNIEKLSDGQRIKG